MKRISFLFLGLILTLTRAYSTPIPPSPPQTVLRELKAEDFEHQVGKQGNRGWEVDYRKDRQGYIFSTLREPLLLESGNYRVVFHLRRGIYPQKGLLHDAYDIFRLELWDVTSNERVDQRDLQMSDFSGPNKYEKRWIDFDMEGREGHVMEPRVYWLGLANGEVEKAEIIRFPDASPSHLEEKALRLGHLLESKYLENGFVVSRQLDGSADETGDATTYTGWYTASLAWKYSVTKDPLTLQSIENAIQALHNTIKGSYDRPLVTRFVDEDGTPYPNTASKDSYAALYFAYATAYPYIENKALKNQMAEDLERITNRYLKEGLSFREGTHELLGLTPYFSEDEVRDGIRKLLKDKDDHRKFLKSLKTAETYIPFGDLWPGSKEVISALKKRDKEKLLELTVPTMNGVMTLAARVRDILREQYRQDLFPKRASYKDYPGKKLERLLTGWLEKFPAKKGNVRFERISDLKVLGSNALISLHLVKTASEVTQKDQFQEYYKTNLYAQDVLLQTAVDWHGMDEEIIRLTAGNAAGDRSRKGYLGALSLTNLIRMEKNPAVKKSYQALMEKWWQSYRHDDNPMAAVLTSVSLGKKEGIGIILRDLDIYPEDRRGYGRDYWRAYGTQLGERDGGGAEKRYSREPLPVSVRPKDSFLWQRNSRQLFGDDEKDYPPTDYLFVYWCARAHNLIPAGNPLSTVNKP